MIVKHIPNTVKYTLVILVGAAFLAVSWGWLAIAFYVQTGFMAIFAGFMAGLIASLFFEKERRWYYYGVGLFCTIAVLFLGQYIEYAFLYEENMLAELNLKKFNASVYTLISIQLSKVSGFIRFFSRESGFLEWFWLMLAVATYTYQLKKIPEYQKKWYELKRYFQK